MSAIGTSRQAPDGRYRITSTVARARDWLTEPVLNQASRCRQCQQLCPLAQVLLKCCRIDDDSRTASWRMSTISANLTSWRLSSSASRRDQQISRRSASTSATTASDLGERGAIVVQQKV